MAAAQLSGDAFRNEEIKAEAVIPNPYGTVPVFHFANNADIGSPGRSELDSAIPVQDGLNKSVLDMLVAMEFSAYRPRWAAGGESLKKAETRFIAKVRDRQASFGQTWSDLMEFALKIKGRVDDVRLITTWEDPASNSEREILENIILKKQLGISIEQALMEAGYGSTDILKMLK